MGSNAIRLFAAGLVAGATAVALPGSGAAAAPGMPVERHCVAEVIDIQNDVLITSPEVCFLFEAEAASYATSRTGTPGTSTRSSASNTIGVHYTSTGFGGSSITITGTTCGGGVWLPTGSWNNNIESSRHYCGSSPTTFYDSSNCVTSPYATYSQLTSLGSMNNKASCVRYG